MTKTVLNRRRGAMLLIVLSLLLSGVAPIIRPAESSAAPVPWDGESIESAQTSSQLIAYLHLGDLWLMNLDGSDARQITSYPEGVRRYAWSPSGRYLLMLHGGAPWHWSSAKQEDVPQAQLSLYDLSTGELRDLITLTSGTSYPQYRFPAWAEDADELVMAASDSGTHVTLYHLSLDGGLTPLTSYDYRPTCGGPSGPDSVTLDLYWMQELGGFFDRDRGVDLIWWTDQDLAYLNRDCNTAISINLVNGDVVDFGYGSWIGTNADRLMLIDLPQNEGSQRAGIYDPALGLTTPIDGGESMSWGPGDQLFSTSVTKIGDSSFSSPFDSFAIPYVDNSIEFKTSDAQNTAASVFATIDAFGAGLLGVTFDGTSVIAGIVDNPTDMQDVDTSTYSDYGPDIYGEHQRVVRIDVATGDVVTVANHAHRPRLQPRHVESGSQPVATAAPESGNDAEAGVLTAGQNWIAYIGVDGNVWVVQPDGSNPIQITTDAVENHEYADPRWSHDGTMLAFWRLENEGREIWLYQSGSLDRVLTSQGCMLPAFSRDDDRLLLVCQPSTSVGDPMPDDLQTNPLEAFVSSIKLDGSDFQVEIPYTPDDSGVTWTSESKSGIYANDIDVRISDGTMLVVYNGFHQAGIVLFDASGTMINEFDFYDLDPSGALGPFSARFSPDGESIIASYCATNCYPNQRNASYGIISIDLDRNVLQSWTSPDALQGFNGADFSPDGQRVIASYSTETSARELVLISTPGAMMTVAQGSSPDWQPGPTKISSTETQSSNGRAARIADMLPTLEEMPAGLMIVEEGKRSRSATVATFPDSDEAAANLELWNWKGCVYRQFGPSNDGQADGIASIEVTIHRFADAGGASAALPYFAAEQSSTPGLTTVDAADIGEQSVGLQGMVDGRYQTTIYVLRGSVLIRVSVISSTDFRVDVAENVAELVASK